MERFEKVDFINTGKGLAEISVRPFVLANFLRSEVVKPLSGDGWEKKKNPENRMVSGFWGRDTLPE